MADKELNLQTELILTEAVPIACVRLTGKITPFPEGEFKDYVIKQFEGKAEAVLIDLKEITYLDSCALGLLTALYMSLFRRKIPIAYMQAKPEVRQIIATSHLDRILPLFDVPDEALAFIRSQAAG